MSIRETVPVVIETTDAVEPRRAFDYWRSTALARVDATLLAPDHGFAASRRVALSRHGAILHTVSNPVGVERTARHARADGRDDIAVVVLLRGTGYLEQVNNGGLLSAGDVEFHTMDQAFAIGSRDGYEDICFQVLRSKFLAQVGNPQEFAGRKLRAAPLSGLFAGYLRSFSESVATLSQAEAGIHICIAPWSTGRTSGPRAACRSTPYAGWRSPISSVVCTIRRSDPTPCPQHCGFRAAVSKRRSLAARVSRPRSAKPVSIGPTVDLPPFRAAGAWHR